jgi:hypothetical protein
MMVIYNLQSSSPSTPPHPPSQAGFEPDVLIVLDLPDHDAIRRATSRLVDPLTGRAYTDSSASVSSEAGAGNGGGNGGGNGDLPADPAVAARLVRRAEDSEAAVRARLRGMESLVFLFHGWTPWIIFL